MAHRVRYRHGASLRNAEQRDAFEPSSIDHRLEIAHENLVRNLFDLAIRKAIAVRVIADQRVIPRQFAIEAALVADVRRQSTQATLGLFRPKTRHYEWTYGAGADWVRNVLTAGACKLITRGRRMRCPTFWRKTTSEPSA